MAELMDNSGPYNPSRKFEDFSEEFLIKLLKAYMRAYTLVDGFWNTEVRNTGKLAEEDIINCEIGVWKSGEFHTAEYREADQHPAAGKGRLRGT